MKRPRVRDSEERRVVSQVLSLFARKSKRITETLPALYLHGLALRGL